MWNLQKEFSLRTIKVCRFEIIDGVKYVYFIKHTFLLREQVGFAAVLWRLRQCVSCIQLIHLFDSYILYNVNNIIDKTLSNIFTLTQIQPNPYTPLSFYLPPPNPHPQPLLVKNYVFATANVAIILRNM